MKLSILVPFRDADGTRTRAKEWILARWAHFYPEAEIIVEPDDGIDPFNKSYAVNRCAEKATGDTFMVLDADTWVEPAHISRAFNLIAHGIPWVVPANRHMRLRREFSERLMKLDPKGPLPPIQAQHAETQGPVVGFAWIIPRKAWEAVGGMDERIRGWGGEDTSFTWAMDRVNGRHRRLNGVAMCLWHDRPRDARRNRIWVGQDRSQEQEKALVVQAYSRARTRDAMLAVLGKAAPIVEAAPVRVPPWKKRRTA